MINDAQKLGNNGGEEGNSEGRGDGNGGSEKERDENIVGFLFLDPSVRTQFFFFIVIVNSPPSRYFSLIINPNYLSRV